MKGVSCLRNALAFLLLKNRVSVAVTIGPSFNVVLTNQLDNPPLAFDFSHALALLDAGRGPEAAKIFRSAGVSRTRSSARRACPRA